MVKLRVYVVSVKPGLHARQTVKSLELCEEQFLAAKKEIRNQISKTLLSQCNRTSSEPYHMLHLRSPGTRVSVPLLLLLKVLAVMSAT